MAGQDQDEGGVVAPIMPTGSGVADLEIAREQDALANEGDDTGSGATPIANGPDANESEAHPS